jgi:activator of 2-hydroxyglutaryl-CoA dehydratase
MASRVNLGRRVLFVGGVARNPCMARALGQELGVELVVPDRPEAAVAFGAALVGLDEAALRGPDKDCAQQ